MSSKVNWLAVTLVAAAFAAGCTGVITDPSPSGGETTKQKLDCSTKERRPGRAPVRRLTNREFDNTIRDLLGDDSRRGESFAPDAQSLGFDNMAQTQSVSPLLAEQYESAVREIATTASGDVQSLLGCDPDSDATCVRKFVTTFGKRAFRRPLEATEIDRRVSFYDQMKASYGTSDGVRLLLEAFLLSPSFLYRLELDGAVAGADVVKLSAYEVATRLSYFLWGSMPDDELFAAADAGQLETPGDVAEQARRMLQDPRARDAVASFTSQWLSLARLDSTEKDPALFPGFTAGIRPLLREQTLRFFDYVLFEGDARWETLLTSKIGFLNQELGAFYGVSQPPSGEALQKVELDEHASGFLTHAGLLSILAHENQTSLVERGKFVREMLLCDDLPSPPPDLVVVPPDPDPNATTRERFAEHVKDPSCALCHDRMDPIGFTFEHFGADGRWREKENGLPIDASGELTGTDADGKLDGVRSLAERLAQSEQVQKCVVMTWFRYAHGRGQEEADACSIESARQIFSETGGNVLELIVALTKTDAFLYRTKGEASP